MKTITNVLANINPSTLPVIGGYPAMDVSLIDANFQQLITDEIAVIKTSSYVFLAADMDRIFIANKSTAISFTLISSASVASGNWLWIFNIGAGVLTLTGTVNGVSNPTIAQYDGMILFTNGTSWYGFVIKAIPALATLAATATISNSLSMQGEDSVAGSTASSSLTEMNVLTGDKIFVFAQAVFSSNTAADVGALAITKSAGTATITYGGGTTSLEQTVYMKLSATNYAVNIAGVIEVTGDGTLTLNSAISVGGVVTVVANNIKAFFLKKQ